MTEPPRQARTGQRPTDRKSIRGSAALMAGKLVSTVPVLGLHVLLARSLTATEFAAFGYALSVTALVATIVPLGTIRALPRLLVEREGADEAGQLGAVLFPILLIVGGASIVWIALASTSQLGFSLTGEGLAVDLTLALFLVAPLEAFDRVAETVCAVRGVVSSIVVRKYLVGPALRFGAVAAAVLGGAGIVGIAAAYVVAVVVGTVLYWWIAARALGVDRPAPYRAGLGRLAAPLQLRRGTPLVVHGALHTLIAVGGVLFIGALATTEDVAVFRAAAPLAQFSVGLVIAFGITFSPLAARAATAGRLGELRPAYWQYAAWVAVLTSPLLLLLASFPGPVLEFAFGDRFPEAAWTLRLLAIGYFFHGASGFHGLTLMMVGATRSLVGIDLIVAAIYVGANIVLIPSFGATGAAIAVVVALALLAVTSLAIASRLGIGMAPRANLIIVGVAALLVAIGASIGKVTSPPIALAVGYGAVASIVVYLVARPALDLAALFPEAANVPVLRRLV